MNKIDYGGKGSEPMSNEVHRVLDKASKFHDELNKMTSGYFNPTALTTCLGIKTFISLKLT